MKRALLILATCLLASPAVAGDDWKKTISEDQIEIKDGKMTSESFSLCKIGPPDGNRKSMQIRDYVEAPVDSGLSRDFVVSFSTMMQTILLMGFAQASSGSAFNLDNLDCNEINAPIGTVDFEINIYMTGEGFQLAIKNNGDGSTSRESERWEDMFDE
jgi:hypothetical protein